MGTAVYWMNTSVDLLIEQSPDDHTGKEGTGSWMRIDEELHRATSRERRSLPFLTVDDEVSGNHLAIARWGTTRKRRTALALPQSASP